MSHRRFALAHDAENTVSRQWLLPGERLLYVSTRTDVLVEMPRRNRDGKFKSPLILRILKWTFLFPILLWLIMEAGDFGTGGKKRPATVVAFGPDPRCLASGHLAPGVKRNRGFWVLTDRRFAYLQADPTGDVDIAPEEPVDVKTAIANLRNKIPVSNAAPSLPPEPVRLTPVFEYSHGQFSTQGVVARELPRSYRPRTARYQRVLLPDGSGVDLLYAIDDPERSGR
ncbi:hypothetical protein LX16_0175 [Stackebrandtia albiflava]|uniref:Uncharacterized protein n=1 Tax=Stackebrandtia albiflava TaxID=406432 RepID=A0A562V9D4_9ACTN|nr:hypothetical protein [Stackebrandtia albiflava]TWJ14491.1 hypothetical protein LX16_0175 [Stackebrandtia albiflava]